MKIQKYEALSLDHMTRAVGSYYQMTDHTGAAMWITEPVKQKMRHFIVQKKFVDWGMRNHEELIEIDPDTLIESDEYWDTDLRED